MGLSSVNKHTLIKCLGAFGLGCFYMYLAKEIILSLLFVYPYKSSMLILNMLCDLKKLNFYGLRPKIKEENETIDIRQEAAPKGNFFKREQKLK